MAVRPLSFMSSKIPSNRSNCGVKSKSLHLVVELDERHLMSAMCADALDTISKSIEHGFHGLHAGTLLESTLHNVHGDLVEGC